MQLITDALAKAHRWFAEHELAYLALTSKVERPFLDRLAFYLHRQARRTGLTVAREYSLPGAGRADIALLGADGLAGIVEGKAMTGASCARKGRLRREWPDMLQKDLDRYKAWQRPSVPISLLLLGTFHSRPPRAAAQVVKYTPLIERAFADYGSGAQIEAAAQATLGDLIRSDRFAGTGTVAAGKAFGASVHLRWWLFGPFVAPDRLALLRRPGA